MSECRACLGDGMVRHFESVPRPSGCTAERVVSSWVHCAICDGTGYEAIDPPVDDDDE